MPLDILRVSGGEKMVEGNTRGDSLRPVSSGAIALGAIIPVPAAPSPTAHYTSFSTPPTPGVIL